MSSVASAGALQHRAGGPVSAAKVARFVIAALAVCSSAAALGAAQQRFGNEIAYCKTIESAFQLKGAGVENIQSRSFLALEIKLFEGHERRAAEIARSMG
jgi:hypothetical protein